MTIYELIEKLQSFNQDMEVIVHDNRWNENLNIVEVEYHDDKVAVVHGKTDITVSLAVSVVHSNKDMETPRRGIK